MLDSQYEVIREIGRGGMGIVYLGLDRRLKREVAIKLLPPELAYRSEIRSRFLKEAETAARLSHPNIVPIYSVDEREGLVYFVMGFVDGENLGQRLQKQGRIGGEDTRRILRDVADALAYAHARGVIHRDIKPDNILIFEEDGRVMVTDFGIARAVTEGDSRLTATGMAIGTPAYMSPEQSAGERQVDGRTDQYSLGVVGYQMLTGEPPFTANSTPALLIKQISEEPPPLRDRVPHCPADLASIVMRMLEKDPDNRFDDAGAVVQALDLREVHVSSVRAPASVPAPAMRTALPSSPAQDTANLPDVPVYSAELEERWMAPEVVKYRRRVAFYVAVNGVFLLLSLFGGKDLLSITTIWTVLMAYWYAGLWTNGYDWRDVFKQPREKLFIDAAAETVDDARALFNKEKRAEVRERERLRRIATQNSTNAARKELSQSLFGSGPLRDRVAAAYSDSAEIERQWRQLSPKERERLPDFAETASQLARRAESLAVEVVRLERNADAGTLDGIDDEILALEARANPNEGAISEERIRRLAYLKRQRRATIDATSRLESSREKLESCLLALQNLRFDLVRLDLTAQDHQRVTTLVHRAQRLASDLDGIVSAEETIGRRPLSTSGRSTGGP